MILFLFSPKNIESSFYRFNLQFSLSLQIQLLIDPNTQRRHISEEKEKYSCTLVKHGSAVVPYSKPNYCYRQNIIIKTTPKLIVL